MTHTSTDRPLPAQRVRLQRPGRQDGVLGVRAATLGETDDAEDRVAPPDTGDPWTDLLTTPAASTWGRRSGIMSRNLPERR